MRNVALDYPYATLHIAPGNHPRWRMDIRSEIVEIEAKLQSRRITTRALCEAAGINASTWTRWKSGSNGPNLGTWLRVRSAFEALLSPQSKQDAA
jgi:hypothetical protein